MVPLFARDEWDRKRCLGRAADCPEAERRLRDSVASREVWSGLLLSL